MKILFLNYEYPPLGGGAGRATHFIFKELSNASDLEIDFVTSSIDSEYHFEKVGQNINIHRLPIGKSREGLHFQTKKDLLIYPWKAFWFCRKLIKKNKYDLSHSFFTVPCGALSWYFKLRYGLPYIISLRGSDVPGYSERFQFMYKFIGPIIHLIWSKADLVIANSQGLRELAVAGYAKKEIGVISNGADIEKFAPNEERKKTAEQPLVLLCVSRITPRKGIRYIVEAVKKIKSEGGNLVLKLIGEGNEKEEMEQFVRDEGLEQQVEFLGIIEHDDLPAHYANADIYVSASMNEGMSNTMLEALASGLPIVATKTGGTDEIVREGKNGFVVAKKSSDDLAEKISIIMKDTELRNSMAKQSRALAKEMSWASVAKGYHEAYKKIINK